MVFHCSSVYLTAITEPRFPEWYYSRNGRFSPFLISVTFVILTVDNSHEYLKRNAENPDIYDCYPQSEKFLSPVNIKTHKKLLECE